MADNVAITAGSGTTIAADEVTDGTLGTVKVQYVKIMDGTLDGTTKATVGAGGLAVDTELPAAAALADAASNPTAPAVGAFNTIWNGSTWDRLRLVSAGALADGTSNPTTAGIAAFPLAYNGSTWDRIQANANKAVKVTAGGYTATISSTPTVSASPAYSSGDCVGGKLTFSNAALYSSGTFIIQNVRIVCKSAQTFACDVVFFRADPASTTFTDNSAIALNSADFDKVCGVAQVTGTSPYAWVNMGTPSFANVGNCGIPVQLSSGTSLYGIIVSRGTPTLGSTSDITVFVDLLQDF